MKHIVRNIVLCTLYMVTLSFFGCKDFLTVEPESQLSTDNFYKTPANVDQAVIGVYGALKPFAKYWYVMSELRSDNLFEIKEAKQYDAADCAQFNATGLLNDAIVANCWSDHYTLIAAANVLLDRLPKVEFSKPLYAEQYEAEVRFLRALAYFDLVRFYGRVPVSLHELTTAEAFDLKQSEPMDVYTKAIVPDLRFAVNHLQETAVDYKGTAHVERATRVAAEALLGKVYLQMAGYPLYADTKDSARICFKNVLDACERYWTDDMATWNNLWIHENDNTRFIFEIQYECAAGQGNPASPLAKLSNTVADDYCNAYLTNGNHFYVERELQQHFLEQKATFAANEYPYLDARGQWTIAFGSTIIDEETGTAEVPDNNRNNFMFKHFEHKLKRAGLGYSDMDKEIVTSTYWPQNFPVLRIEDIALLYAECVGATEGLPYLNRVHTKAGLDPYAALDETAFQEAVKQERRYELLGEGHRWFDQVRQNTYVEDSKAKFITYRDKYDAVHSNDYTVYASRVNQHSALYPIPLSQIQVRDGLYDQNPGY